MEYYWCEKCKSYQYGSMTTGGFYCSVCGKITIYIENRTTADYKKISGYYYI